MKEKETAPIVIDSNPTSPTAPTNETHLRRSSRPHVYFEGLYNEKLQSTLSAQASELEHLSQPFRSDAELPQHRAAHS